jgi:hypothetical protein
MPYDTRDSVAVELFDTGGYALDFRKRSEIAKRIDRAWKALDDAALIEEPDADNDKNGYRVISLKGKSASSAFAIQAAKTLSAFRREMFHPTLPEAAWNAFRAGHYDTAVLEAFKAIEAAVYQKGKYTGSEHDVSLMMVAFNPAVGRIKAPDPSRAEARRNLFAGAFGLMRFGMQSLDDLLFSK